MNKNCAGCGKPVYFAERKTSLGREWHPSCLKCTQCGKVLAPGQHAEHKSMPYCHHPCYRALFGPAILGYGSNIHSPANFAPKREGGSAIASNANRASTGSLLSSVISEETRTPTYSLSRRSKPKHHLVHHNSNGAKAKNLITSKSLDNGERDVPTQSAAPVADVPNSPVESLPETGLLENNGSPAQLRKKPTAPVQRSFSHGPLPSRPQGTNSTLPSSIRPSSQLPPPASSSAAAASSPAAQIPSIQVSNMDRTPTSSGSAASTPPSLLPKEQSVSNPKLQEMMGRLEEFNKYYEGKIHNQMTAKERGDGSILVEGPLRIYWGLSRPIQLAHCDDIPPAPISQWRHSLHVGAESPVTSPKKSFGSMSLRRTGSPQRKSRDLDDLMSPSSPDDVVRRKKVRKFKTVAYRGSDQPSKWKRASINGHIFNFDTSVFTPVLGSCTSVTVDATYSTHDVIDTLLDKFKVQNSSEEYVLSIVNEEGERLLTNQDRPLLERLRLGPEETLGKIFIKEREVRQEEGVGELVVSTLPGDGDSNKESGRTASHTMDSLDSGDAGLRRNKRSASIKMPIRETEEEENLPHEVEQLLVLPEAVLRGLLVKYHNDEEIEVKKIRARYTVVKQRIAKQLDEALSHTNSSTA